MDDLLDIDVSIFKTLLVAGYSARAGTLSYDQNGTTLTPVKYFCALLGIELRVW